MKLSTDQQKQFESWLRQKIEHSACTLCQSNHWKIGDVITPAHASDAVDELGPPSSMIQLICKNCAHVLLFDTRYIKGWDTTDDLSHQSFMM